MFPKRQYMPIFDAMLLDTDPEGCELLKAVLLQEHMCVHADRRPFSGRRTPRRAWDCTSTQENIEVRTAQGRIIVH